jgi:hypothetical protein
MSYKKIIYLLLTVIGVCGLVSLFFLVASYENISDFMKIWGFIIIGYLSVFLFAIGFYKLKH